MEETALDFESLVLGKKKVSSVTTYPPSLPALQQKPIQLSAASPQPSSPGNLMAPLRPTTSTSPSTSPPPPQTSFFMPLTPATYSASSSANMSTILQPTPANGMFPGSPTANFAYNPWQLNNSFPTIAPPPNKPTTPVIPGYTGQNKPDTSGLDKYQSLL
jgi:hypothetical protein